MKDAQGNIVFKIAAVDTNNKIQEIYTQYFNIGTSEKKYNSHWRYILLDDSKRVKQGDMIDTINCELSLGEEV